MSDSNRSIGGVRPTKLLLRKPVPSDIENAQEAKRKPVAQLHED